jgi:hypothetical protein
MPGIRSRIALPAVLGLALAVAACENPAAGNAAARIPGDYHARTFQIVADGESADLLAGGARIDLQLRADGSTDGRLLIPGMDEDGGDMDESLAGTWTLRGDTVRLQHAADTFLRDMPLLARGRRLEGDHTFSGTRVVVSLER